MKIKQAPYFLRHWEAHEWSFVESEEIRAATVEFDHILEKCGWYISNPAALARFLKKHPNHIDALHHYSDCKRNQGKYLDALAFSHAAVAIGLRAFPKEFVIGRDRLSTGSISNRPFLRAMYGLMSSQRAVGLIEDAIETAQMCLGFDVRDRNAARLELPVFLLETDRDLRALELFENPEYQGTFYGVEYLRALALVRLGRQRETEKVFEHCLHYYPLVAKHLLNPGLPQPESSDALFGVVSGSEFEGWMHAEQMRHLWDRASLDLLRRQSAPIAKLNWKRWSLKQD